MFQSLLNLMSFFCPQENEIPQADKYAEVAMQADRYNPAGEVQQHNIFIEFSLNIQKIFNILDNAISKVVSLERVC